MKEWLKKINNLLGGKIFLLFLFVLIFMIVSVWGNLGESGESGIIVDNYYTGSGKLGTTQDISFNDSENNNHVLNFEDGLLVNYNFTEYVEPPMREEIVITENSGETLVDYPILLNITYNINMSTDFSDIRFFDSSITNKLDYFIESKSDGNWASIWVNIPQLDASQNTVIYLYYNETNVSSESNAYTVFTFYDDFSSTNTTKWQANAGSLSVSGGEAIVNDDMLVGDVSTGYGYTFEYEGRSWSDGTGMQDVDSRSGIVTPDYIFGGINCNGLAFNTINDSNGSGICPFGGLPSDGDILGAFRVNSSAVEFYKNNVLQTTFTTNIPDSELYFGMRSWDGKTMYFDWTRIRKLVSEEPTVDYN